MVSNHFHTRASVPRPSPAYTLTTGTDGPVRLRTRDSCLAKGCCTGGKGNSTNHIKTRSRGRSGPHFGWCFRRLIPQSSIACTGGCGSGCIFSSLSLQSQLFTTIFFFLHLPFITRLFASSKPAISFPERDTTFRCVLFSFVLRIEHLKSKLGGIIVIAGVHCWRGRAELLFSVVFCAVCANRCFVSASYPSLSNPSLQSDRSWLIFHQSSIPRKRHSDHHPRPTLYTRTFSLLSMC